MYHYHHLISCRHSKMRRRYLFFVAIDMLSAFRYTFLCQREERGGIAQLGERLHGMQEVRGSIPLVSTISTLMDAREILHPFFLAINIHLHSGWIFIARKNASLCDAYLSDGAPGGIRTLDPRLRRPLLYPTELQVHGRDDRI